MSIISVQQISKIYNGESIFREVSFDIKENERVGLVGRNGTGKTTIFKLLTGDENQDGGSIFIKKDLNIGYLEQIPLAITNYSVKQVLEQAFDEIIQINKRMKQLEVFMSETENQQNIDLYLKEYGMLQEKFSRLNGYEMESEISKVVAGLGITSLLDQEFQLLSGGEKTKVGLALLLLQKPELLLLDEPTNHLDIDAVDWLEKFLTVYQGTIIVISHDRYFLDKVATKILDLDNGELTTFVGNYSSYVEEKEKRLLAEFDAYQDQQKKIKKMKEAIKRLKEWANRANPPNEGLHRRAANMEKALERMEKLKRPNIDSAKIHLQFHTNERSGNEVIKIEGIGKSFNHQFLFKNVNFYLRYGEQVAIIGKNGTGKSSLIKMMVNEMNPDYGKITIGSNVKIGYLSQNILQDVENVRVIEAFRDKAPVTEEAARHILAKFLFYGNSVFKKVKDLSGGEKIRLRLAQLIHQDINLLILDEPTNHLDIDSREELEQSLAQFKGSIICISHDRYLLNKLFQITYWLNEGELLKYEGNYEYAKQKHMELLSTQSSNVFFSSTIKPKNNRSDEKVVEEKDKYSSDYKQKKKLIESQITQIEHELFILEERMFDIHDYEELKRLQEKKESMENQRTLLYGQLDSL